MSGLKFFKNFIKSPATTGAVWPTGPILAQQMVKILGEYSNKNIAEIGPGTGAITKYLINTINESNNFFAIEINKEFYEHLKQDFPATKFYNDDASNLSDIIKKEENINELDAVISGLPWAAFPEKLQINILEAIHDSLKPDGKFNTFAYLQGLYLPTGLKFKKLLKKYFSEIKTSKIVWRNIPPAIVYECTK